MIILIVLLTFSCIALTVMSLYWTLVRPGSVVNAQLESADPSLALIENNPLTTMTRAAEPLNRIVPSCFTQDSLHLTRQWLTAPSRYYYSWHCRAWS